jgi:hypothetical protein
MIALSVMLTPPGEVGCIRWKIQLPESDFFSYEFDVSGKNGDADTSQATVGYCDELHVKNSEKILIQDD